MPTQNSVDIQVANLKAVYEVLEELKPHEGRDYSVVVQLHTDTISVLVEGITPLGEVYAEHCKRNIQAVIAPTMLEQYEAGEENAGRNNESGSAEVSGNETGTGSITPSSNTTGDPEEHVL